MLVVSPQTRPITEIESVSPALLLQPAMALAPELEAAFQAFWNLSPKVRLFSIADSPHYFWHMQDFYVAQKGLDDDGKRWAQLRISEALCQMMFERILGKSQADPEFSLSHIRNFEIFLLERFSRKLFQTVSESLIQTPSKKTAPSEMEPMMHLVWIIEGEMDEVSQLVLSIPMGCVRNEFPPKPPAEPLKLPDYAWMHAHSEVIVRVGQTKAKLDDLKQLEVGDLVVFEDSNPRFWKLWNPTARRWHRFAIRLPEHLTVPSNVAADKQGPESMPQNTQPRPNIWDNLEVEVTAAFNPIKLPLKQLKEMEQGLVLEVGELLDNKVQIEVEGHPIAWGELLVLGDKFGVRIHQIHEAVERMDARSAAVTPVEPEQHALAAAEAHPQQAAPPEQPGQQMAPNELLDLDLDESDFDDLDGDEDWN